SSARAQLERLVRATQRRFPAVSDVARSVRFRWFDQPQVDAEREQVLSRVASEVADLAAHPDAADYAERVAALAIVPERMSPTLAARLVGGVSAHEPLLEILLRKHYRDYELTDVRAFSVAGRSVVVADCVIGDRQLRVITANAVAAELDAGGPVAAMVADQLHSRPQGHEAVVELYVGWPSTSDQDRAIGLREQVRGWELAGVRRVTIAACSAEGDVDYITFRPDAAGEPVEDERIRGVHPMVFRRLNLWRLSEFDATRLPAPRGVLLFDCVAKSNPDDRRLVAMAEVSQLAAVRDANGRLIGLPHAERAVENCLESIRRTRAARGSAGSRLDMNHVWVYVWPEIELDLRDVMTLQHKITPLSDGTGIEEVVAQGTFVGPDTPPTKLAIRFHAKPGSGVAASVVPPPTEPLQPLDDYTAQVIRARRRGLVYPYELSETLAGPGGSMVELDLDPDVTAGAPDRLIEVKRRPGQNKAGIIAGLVTTPTPLYPDGITRIVLSGDP
ncbi:MAG TPA: fused acetyl/propionyl-CoA carboxylase subunit alpha/methylmalonyl-CoA decarboxylase subunit alpha, partial [Propionicimonas sp.]|nr:fused acetyl/propionyl-CoA carboxylase subunit alpha/methylmalonyl-CoA decarboxylase subunit alpha [Propionicimonas sp.]